jgi:hypothetical protein
MNFTQLHTNLNNVIDNLDSIVIDSAMENENSIVDLNTSQLELGLTSEGNSIEPEYFDPEYTKYKKAIGKKAPGATPDLKLTGDFHSGFYAKKTQDWIEIHSTDYKEKQLRAKYSDEIFGLTQNNLNELGQIILPDLIKNIKNELGIG